VPGLIAALKSWYPDVVVGEESCHLRPEFWLEEVQLLDARGDRGVFGIVTRKDRELASFCTFEKNPDSKAIRGRLGAVSPDHRGAKLGSLPLQVVEALGRAMGAELLMTFITLKHPYALRAVESAGYRIAGIVPGFDRDQVAPGTIKRVFEALYVKLLVPEEALLEPSLENMTPTARELFCHLFKVGPASRGGGAPTSRGT
jgi:hypothetical protein